jgi:hypothetical protein
MAELDLEQMRNASTDASPQAAPSLAAGGAILQQRNANYQPYCAVGWLRSVASETNLRAVGGQMALNPFEFSNKRNKLPEVD